MRPDDVLAALDRHAPLFALLDAARERSIPTRLLTSKLTFASLYEGAPDLADHGPFLVELPRGAPLLQGLIREGWNKSWGVYLSCDLPFADLRRHLRRFLMVRLPDGREAYFRFYDPRVLRVFLARSTAREASTFMGPVSRYFVEDGESTEALLQFSHTPGSAAPEAPGDRT